MLRCLKKYLRWTFFCACTLSLAILLRLSRNLAFAQTVSQSALAGFEKLIDDNTRDGLPRPYYSWVTINGEPFSQEHSSDSLSLREKQEELQSLCLLKGGLFQLARQALPSKTAEDSRSLGVCVFLQDDDQQALSLGDFILSPRYWRLLKRIGFEAYQARPLDPGVRVTTTRGALSLNMLQPNSRGDTPGADLPLLPRPTGKRILSLGHEGGTLAATYQLTFPIEQAKQRYAKRLVQQGFDIAQETDFGLVVAPQLGSIDGDSRRALPPEKRRSTELYQRSFVSFAPCLEDSSTIPCSTATLFRLSPQ